MFFPERIQSIKPGDRVLEVGPGCTPHPRADVYLDRKFDQQEALAQRGNTPEITLQKPLFYFEGIRFPFQNDSFDYVICSHVIEHVEDVPGFFGELTRVAAKGYLEFPTPYYEYLYNFRVHLNLVHYNGSELLWMKKTDIPLDSLKPAQVFFLRTLAAGYDDLIKELKPYFAIGFEWKRGLTLRMATNLEDMCPINGDFVFSPPASKKGITGREMVKELGRRLLRRCGLRRLTQDS